MNDGARMDRLFRWIDLIKIVLYGIIAGTVALTAWATKIQLQINENKGDIETQQLTATHYRDIRNEERRQEEHRLSVLEQWTRDRGGLLDGRQASN